MLDEDAIVEAMAKTLARQHHPWLRQAAKKELERQGIIMIGPKPTQEQWSEAIRWGAEEAKKIVESGQ